MGSVTSDRDEPALSVVIPVKDEAGNIQPLLDEIAAVLNGRTVFEVICVDDGSADGTDDEIRTAQRNHPWLRLVRHEKTCGQSTATWTGVHAAHAAWVVTMDGDGQNPPADIPRLIEARDTSAEPNLRMVAGQRERRYDSWLRRLSSWTANSVRARLLRDGIRDSGCALKLFRRDAFLALPYFDHMHRFLPALIQRHGGAVVTVPVGHRARRQGQSKYGLHNRLWPGILDLAGVLWLKRRTKLPIIDATE